MLCDNKKDLYQIFDVYITLEIINGHILGLGFPMSLKAKLYINLCYVLFTIIPYKFLIALYPSLKTHKCGDVLDSIICSKFYKKSKLYKDFDSFIIKAKHYKKYCIIENGNWSYRIINFLFVNEMLSMVVWCLERGYKPIINVYPTNGIYSEQTNLWEKMFLQPFDENSNVAMKSGKCIKCPITSFPIFPDYKNLSTSENTMFWNRFYKEFYVFNDRCRKYIDDEYNTILKGKLVLGCLGRGTDYTDTKPKGHPVQPTIEELLNKCRETIKRYDYKYIYLATEEKKIADRFKLEFGESVILENKRFYFDVQYDADENMKRVSQVSFGRENDDFLKCLEYMSSINLLSKCNALVAGRCGGSRAAVFLNGLQYSEIYLFDKGLY